MEDVVNWEVKKLGNLKGCPLAPFIYHLYAGYGILTRKEKREMRMHQEKMARERLEENSIEAIAEPGTHLEAEIPSQPKAGMPLQPEADTPVRDKAGPLRPATPVE